MDLQKLSELEKTQNSIIYDPIKFVYTETIGSIKDKINEIMDPYCWQFEDILQPKTIKNNNYLFYYLFHIAPIYNWLRKVSSKILKDYIESNKTIGLIRLFNYKKIQKRIFFDSNIFYNQLKHYTSQWQIVKLCAAAKIKVITTKPKLQQKSNQIIRQDSKIVKYEKKQQFKKENTIKCIHLIKKQIFTSNYELNTFTKDFTLQCKSIFCEQCGKQISVKSEIKKLPFAPIFTKYNGKDFKLLSNHYYQISLIFGKDKIYIKSSNGIWYQVSEQKVVIISFEKIDIKRMSMYVYQQVKLTKKLLKKSEPIKDQNYKNKNQQIYSFGQNGDSESEDLIDQQLKLNKIQKMKIQSKNEINRISQNNKMQIQLINAQQIDTCHIDYQKINGQRVNLQLKQDQLQDMTKIQLSIILNKKKTDKKVFKQYKKTVEGLLPKPKQKDEYQRNYDKGKVKKIHKNRQQFRKADFFNLYKDINKKNIADGLVNKIEKEYGQDQFLQKDTKQQRKIKNSGASRNQSTIKNQRTLKMQGTINDDESEEFQMRISKKFQKRMNRQSFKQRGRARGFKGRNHSVHQGGRESKGVIKNYSNYSKSKQSK